jgi:hypothetical protein
MDPSTLAILSKHRFSYKDKVEKLSLYISKADRLLIDKEDEIIALRKYLTATQTAVSHLAGVIERCLPSALEHTSEFSDYLIEPSRDQFQESHDYMTQVITASEKLLEVYSVAYKETLSSLEIDLPSLGPQRSSEVVAAQAILKPVATTADLDPFIAESQDMIFSSFGIDSPTSGKRAKKSGRRTITGAPHPKLPLPGSGHSIFDDV